MSSNFFFLAQQLESSYGRVWPEMPGIRYEWEATVRRALTCHYRKIGFISGFKAVVAGRHSDVEPSFLDRAKARWEGRYGRNTP